MAKRRRTNRQQNGQKKKDKRTNRDQHISEARHSYPKLTLLYLIIIIGLYSKYLKILPNTVKSWQHFGIQCIR
jgi:hypothetical protein